MTDYKKARVVDLRKQLVEVYGYSVKDAKAVRGKKTLVELIKSKQPDTVPAVVESEVAVTA